MKTSKTRSAAKVDKVMGEFKRGSLKSSSGQTVTNRKQAVAIAMSEAGKSKPKGEPVHLFIGRRNRQRGRM